MHGLIRPAPINREAGRFAAGGQPRQAWASWNSCAAQQGMAQTDKVLGGIYNISTLVPAVGFIALALVLWFWYPLHKKQVDANVEALKAKHENEEK